MLPYRVELRKISCTKQEQELPMVKAESSNIDNLPRFPLTNPFTKYETSITRSGTMEFSIFGLEMR